MASEDIEKKIENKVCRKCGIEKPVNQFRRNLKSPDGYTHLCLSCLSFHRINLAGTLPKGNNPALAQFSPRELIQELRSRGYKGELQYTQVIKI